MRFSQYISNEKITLYDRANPFSTANIQQILARLYLDNFNRLLINNKWGCSQKKRF